MADHPRILALETSSRLGSVAVAHGPEVRAVETFRTDNHAIELMPAIERLCAGQDWRPEDVDELYLSIGPGSFTGLRIAATCARTLARFGGVRLVTVPTLTVLAHNALDADPVPHVVGVILDAKRGEVYAAAFTRHDAGYRQRSAPQVCDPETFLASLAPPRALLGEGLPYHTRVLERVAHTELPEDLWRPRAEWVHRLGWEEARGGRFATASEVIPLYLRIPEAEEVWNRRHGAS